MLTHSQPYSCRFKGNQQQVWYKNVTSGVQQPQRCEVHSSVRERKCSLQLSFTGGRQRSDRWSDVSEQTDQPHHFPVLLWPPSTSTSTSCRMCCCCTFASLSPSTAGLESDYCVWNVQRGPHVERFRQRRALPPPTNQPPQQDQLRGQPEQCPGNGFIRQLRFTASPAKHLLTRFPRIWWKTSKKQR